MVGICPWHDDSRPSLQVNPERQSWKCWVCDIGGDVFSFTMRIEGVDFREALELLAERAGIEMPRRGRGEPAVKTTEKKLLYEAMSWTTQKYHDYLLKSAEAQAARDYLADRQISADSIARYCIGFAPDSWDWLQKLADREGKSREQLESIGVIRKSERGMMYDFFKGRVLFPIRDTQQRTIAFGGRVLPGVDDNRKYINSPETPLFTKNEHVYGLDIARAAAQKTGSVLVMEGYTDVLMAHQFGFTNAVAVLGTALGASHVRLLRRHTDQVVLVLDGDTAGQVRATEVLSLFISAQVDMRVLTLPEGSDPCDYLLTSGAEAFQKLIDESVDALNHKVQVATRGVDLHRDTHQANQALESILQTIAQAPAPQASTPQAFRIRQQQLLTRLSHMFSVDEADLRTRVKELRTGNRTPATATPVVDERRELQPLTNLETEIFEILMAHPEIVSRAIREIDESLITSTTGKRLWQLYQESHQLGHSVEFSSLLAKIDDESLKLLLVNLDESSYNKASSTEEDGSQRLSGLIGAYQAEQIKAENRRTASRLVSDELGPEEETDILQDLLEKERIRQGLSSPKDG